MKKFLILSLCLFSLSFSQAQVVRGKLKDGNNRPLEKAKVFIKGYVDKEGCFTYTDKEGEFSLKIDQSLFKRKSTIILQAKSPDPTKRMFSYVISPLHKDSIPKYINFAIKQLTFEDPEEISEKQKNDLVKNEKLGLAPQDSITLNPIPLKPLEKKEVPKEAQANLEPKQDSSKVLDSLPPNPKKPSILPQIDNPEETFEVLKDNVNSIDRAVGQIEKDLHNINELVQEVQTRIQKGDLSKKEATLVNQKLERIKKRLVKVEKAYAGIRESIATIQGVQDQIEKVKLSMYTYRTWLIITLALLVATVSALLWIHFQSIKLKQRTTMLSLRTHERNDLLKEKDNLILDKDALIEEKNTLIKEINHRVKNNLDLISSIIYFRFKGIRHQDTIEAAEDVRNRIDCLGIVYHMLNDHLSLNTLSIKEYVNKLLENLKDAFNYSKKDIEVHPDIQDIDMNVHTLIPLALVTHELVSNSFKHAFREKSSGKIRVEFRQDDNHICRLVIEDNGDGFEKTKKKASNTRNSIGSRLVDNISKQLGAELKLNTENGVKHTLTFPLKR